MTETSTAVSDGGRQDTPAEDSAGGKVRTVFAVVLGVISVLLLMVSTIAIWARATVFDSEKFASIVDDTLAEPDVHAALATYVTDQVVAAIDVDAAVAENLPETLQQWAAAIASGARAAIERGVTRSLDRLDDTDLVSNLVERAHARAMQILEGDKVADRLTVDDEGAVTLNLLPLIGRGLTAVQERGLFDDLVIPDLAADGDPVEQIAQLEAATGRDLSDDFGQLVVYQSDRLAERHASLEAVQDLFELVKQALWIIFALGIVTLAGSVLLAKERWHAVLWLGLGLSVAMVFIRAVLRLVEAQAPDVAERPGGKAAIESIVDGATTGLTRLAGLVLFVALAATAFALFRRGWRRSDLTAAGGVVAFLAIVAIFGLGLGSLLVGLVVGILVPVLTRTPRAGAGGAGAEQLPSSVQVS